ncbi:MAG: hypothetical protein JO333_05870 [Verrucomicrobia bacterium]|nr:hypothetical protein [Verrucomicrobiota bacterium]
MTVGHLLSTLIGNQLRDQARYLRFQKGLLVEKIVPEHEGISQSINPVLEPCPRTNNSYPKGIKVAATILDKDAFN